ncbi:MAG TPA: hypothetical protein H9991_04670 [Candidatus Mailhella excrementigallinarum]|nr:MAG: hypothetical protein DBY37_16770 [Desulfovibrionaceae bacterium]HIV65533.1 hypothetical protein [Candidatus Mailhella excrementigallinarum]
MALGFIGTRTVASESERTPEAVQCALFWDSARRTALRDYPWNFAQARARLAEVAMPEAWAGEWRHAYVPPDRCLRLHRVLGAGGRAGFMPVHDAEREIVLTDAADALADYTRDVAEPSRWDDAFRMVMARRLACLICAPLLKNNAGKVQELESLYRAALPDAMQSDASEREERAEPDAWLLARGGFDR